MYLQTYLTRQECVINNQSETPAGKLLIGNLEFHFFSSCDSRNRCVLGSANCHLKYEIICGSAKIFDFVTETFLKVY